MRLQRLLLILFYMYGRELVRITDLTDITEVSRRTIYRDIDELRTAGADIVGIPGTGGGFRLSDDFKLERLLFSNREMMSMAFGTKVLSEFGGTEFGKEAEVLAERLRKLLHQSDRDGQGMSDVILIDPEDRFQKEDITARAKICERALIFNASVNVTYESPLCKNLSTCGRVDPYGIVSKAGSWFLVGYCHELETYRAFNTAHMKHIALTGEPYSRDATFSLELFWDRVKPR
jgi:predicted DNA-binding transcriptional regulator YafY